MRHTFNRIGNIVTNQPNWASRVVEEFAFLTAIIEARDGTEKRDALRQTPRMVVQYTSDQIQEKQQRLFMDLNTFKNTGLWIVPTGWRRVSLAAGVLAGDSALSLTNAAPWWLNAGTLLVLESEDVQEAVTVLSVAGTVVTLDAPLEAGFEATDRVMLAHSARYAPEVTMSSRTDQHRQVLSRFDVDPGSAPIWPTEIIDPVVHEGYPAFPARPDWTDKLTTKIEDQRETVDADRGVIDVSRYRRSAKYDYSMTFSEFTQDDADVIIGWFYHSMGRRGHFWMPSLMRDIEIVSDEPALARTLTVPGPEFHAAFADNDTLTTITIRFPDGCVQYNRIESVDLVGGNSVLNFHDVWELPVTRDLKMSFAFLSRFRDDTLVVNWRTSRVAEMSVAFRPVPNTWVPLPVVHSEFPAWPQIYGNNSSNPVTSPSRWLKIDLEAQGVPLAAIDRGECFLRHQQYGESKGLLPGIRTLGYVAFHDADNTVIVTNTEGVMDFHRNSTEDGTEGEFASQYDSGFLLIPANTDYQPDVANSEKFSRAVRYIYLRSSMIYSPVLGKPQNFSSIVEIQAPDWGYYNQVGNLSCP